MGYNQDSIMIEGNNDPTLQHSQMGLIQNPSESSINSEYMAFDRSQLNLRHPKRPDEQYFQILSRMDFTSERRRMSILVRDPRDMHLKLYIKGADDEIRMRLD